MDGGDSGWGCCEKETLTSVVGERLMMGSSSNSGLFERLGGEKDCSGSVEEKRGAEGWVF